MHRQPQCRNRSKTTQTEMHSTSTAYLLFIRQAGGRKHPSLCMHAPAVTTPSTLDSSFSTFSATSHSTRPLSGSSLGLTPSMKAGTLCAACTAWGWGRLWLKSSSGCWCLCWKLLGSSAWQRSYTLAGRQVQPLTLTHACSTSMSYAVTPCDYIIGLLKHFSADTVLLFWTPGHSCFWSVAFGLPNPFICDGLMPCHLGSRDTSWWTRK